MAYLSDFAYDIFISYAHVDDLTAGGGGNGWVTQFHQQLEILLWKRVGRREVKIWRDPALDGNQLFDATIQERVEGAAVFVALTSAGYLASEYCRRELRCFQQKAQSNPHGQAVGDRLRIFNVLLNNIPYTRWPAEYGRSSGFKFHDAQREDDSGYPIDPADKLFEPPLRALADSVFKTLSAMKETAPAPVPVASPEERLFTVYVADAADSLATARKRLINELQQRTEIKVIGNIPPPYEAGAHEQQLSAQLKKTDLSLHLLCEFAGREVEGRPGLCYPQAQAELAIAHGTAPFIWVPQSLQAESVEDDGYKEFLNQLENGQRSEGKYDFVRGTPSTITQEALHKIEELRTRSQPDTAPAAALLDTHFKDQLHTVELSKFLLERRVLPLINPEEDDPRKNLKLFEERLKQVSLLVIVFGQVAEAWVRARLAAALQIAIAENCPLKACGVYLAPPRKAGADLQLSQKLVPIELMDNTEGFNGASVARLLARMN